MRLDCGQQWCQLGVVKRPRHRRGAWVGQAFIPGQPKPERFQVSQVVERQDRPLDERDVDLHLTQPPGVDRGMAHQAAGVDRLPPGRGGFAPGRRAMVHDPAQAVGSTLWSGAHTW